MGERRQLGALALAALLLAPLSTFANWVPDKHIELIIGSAPGGGNDRTGRYIQSLLKDLRLVSVPVTVVNRPGGGGFIGWTYLRQQTGNGHFVSTSTPNLLTTHIAGRSEFTFGEVTPIAQLYSEPSVFVVKADSSLKSAVDLIAKLKSDPASFTTTVGTSAGNHNHIALGALARAVGADARKLKVVIFKGSAEATTAVMGGHVDLAIVAASSRAKQVESGTMRALAVASPQRLTGAYANVPTWKEAGINLTAAFWVGVIGPPGMSAAQVEFWERTFGALARSGEWKTYLKQFGLEDDYMGSSESRRFLELEYKTYRDILTNLGLAKAAVR